MMQRNTVKRIFIFFLILLPLQYVAVGVISITQSEPWPAFILPAFKSVFSSGEHISVDQARFFVKDNENGTRREIDPEILFQGIQRSQLQGFLRSRFADSSQIAALGDEARTWLKRRLAELAPSLNAQELHVQWDKKIFSNKGSSVKTDSIQIIKQFSISLSGE